jgi:hypothetical protein
MLEIKKVIKFQKILKNLQKKMQFYVTVKITKLSWRGEVPLQKRESDVISPLPLP